MKTKLLLSLSLLFIINNCWGQVTFQRVISTPNGCGANAVQQTTDGGYIIAGYINVIGFNYNGVYLIKTNSEGDTLWTKTIAGPVSDYSYSVQQTIDGGYIVAGNTTDTINRQHIYVAKTNAVGDTLWTKVYGGDGNEEANSIQQTNDSGYIITGITNSFGAGGGDAYLVKINSFGDVIWSKTYGGNEEDGGNCVQQTSDSGYIVCGYTFSFGAGIAKVYLIKTKPNGDTLWTKTYKGPGDEFGNSVQQTIDGGYIITGYAEGFVAGTQNVYLIKTNANGDTLWTKTYGGTKEDGGNAVQQTRDSGYIIIGYTISFSVGADDVYLIKTNAQGDTLWTKTYGGTDNDYGYSVKQATDGGFIITGFTNSFVSPNDVDNVYLIKTDANGNSGCHQGSTNTIVGHAPFIVASTNTIIDSGGTASSTNTIVGSDGNDSTLCFTTAINELSINNTITLYPNPATDQLVVCGNWKESSNLKLTIYNILGETIYTEALNSKQETVNCKPFSSCVYFITIADDNEQWVGRFVKE